VGPRDDLLPIPGHLVEFDLRRRHEIRHRLGRAASHALRVWSLFLSGRWSLGEIEPENTLTWDDVAQLNSIGFEVGIIQRTIRILPTCRKSNSRRDRGY
jgi:hypothetical protein